MSDEVHISKPQEWLTRIEDRTAVIHTPPPVEGAPGIQGVAGQRGQGFNPRGDYNSAETYYATPDFDLVYNPNTGDSYICIQGPVSGVEPGTNPAFWSRISARGIQGEPGPIGISDTTALGLSFVGTFHTGTSYGVGNIVYSGGPDGYASSAWVVTSGPVSVPSGSTLRPKDLPSNFQLFAKGGKDGEPGPRPTVQRVSGGVRITGSNGSATLLDGDNGSNSTVPGPPGPRGPAPTVERVSGGVQVNGSGGTHATLQDGHDGTDATHDFSLDYPSPGSKRLHIARDCRIDSPGPLNGPGANKATVSVKLNGSGEDYTGDLSAGDYLLVTVTGIADDGSEWVGVPIPGRVGHG